MIKKFITSWTHHLILHVPFNFVLLGWTGNYQEEIVPMLLVKVGSYPLHKSLAEWIDHDESYFLAYRTVTLIFKDFIIKLNQSKPVQVARQTNHGLQWNLARGSTYLCTWLIQGNSASLLIGRVHARVLGTSLFRTWKKSWWKSRISIVSSLLTVRKRFWQV